MLECPFAIAEEILMMPSPPEGPSTPGPKINQGALMSLIEQPASITCNLNGKDLEAGLQRQEEQHPTLDPAALWLPSLSSLGQERDLAGRWVVCF